MMAPGPELKVAVQCRINRHGKDFQISTTKVFNITVVDRNDNLIKVQDKMTNLTLSSPYFLEVGFVKMCQKVFAKGQINELRVNVVGSLPLGV